MQVSRRHRSFSLSLLMLAGILLATFAVRGLLLTDYSIDGDEAFAISQHTRGTVELTEGLLRAEIDLHPPLYFIGLKFWIAMAGESQIAVRLFSLLASLLALAMAIRLAKELFGQDSAQLLGLLAIPNPLLIWVALEVRMYSLLSLLLMIAVYALLKAVQTQRQRWWWLYIIVAVGAAYTHILGGVALAFGGIVVLIEILRAQRLLIIPMVSVTVASVLYLPFLYFLQQVEDQPPLGSHVPDTLLNFVTTQSGVLVVNHLELDPFWLSVLALTLGLLYFVFMMRYPQAYPVLIVIFVGISVLAFMALNRDIFKPKYSAFLALPLLIVVVGTVHSLKTTTSIFIPVYALVVAGAWIWGLQGLTYDLQPGQRDDWTAVVDYIDTHATADDLVFIVPDWGILPFDFYYDGPARVIAPYSTGSQLTDEVMTYNVSGEGTGLPDGHRTAWVIFYQQNVSDPDNTVENWFRQRYPTRTELFPTFVTVKSYDLQPQSPPTASTVPTKVTFGDQVTLHGVDLLDDEVAATNTRTHPPSGWLPIALYWQATNLNGIGEPVVTLTDPVGRVVAANLNIEVRPNMLWGRYPPTQWAADEIWRVYYDLNINPATPTGTYNIVVQVPDANGNYLPAVGTGASQTWAVLGQVRIVNEHEVWQRFPLSLFQSN